MKTKLSNLGLVSFVLVMLSPALAAANDSPPTTPGTLTAELYAGAGGEIFWSRSSDDMGVRGYEITRNGQSLVEMDALSFYDPTLDASRSTTFTVTAIDSIGQRSGTASVTVGATTLTPPTPDGPAAPDGLRGTVYSSTSAELFWMRAATPGLSYDITLDGNVVATTDGTSYFTDELNAGGTFNYQVVAIDLNGRRSAAATVSLSTTGSAIEPTPADTPADTLAEIRPQDLTIQVYSDTAAELFWTPAGSFRPVIQRNEIRRNGELIATLEGEFLRSYFDDTRTPGTSNTYVVTAISGVGIASATVSDADVSPPQLDPTPVLLVSDLPEATLEKLDTAFEIMNGVAFEQVMATIDRLADPDSRDALGFELVGSGFDFENNPVESYSCPNGGELIDTQNVGPSQRFISELEAIDCAIGPIVFSADVVISSLAGSGPFQSFAFRATNVELVDARDLSTTTSESMSIALISDPRSGLWSVNDLSVDREQGGYSAISVSGFGNDELNALPDGSLGLTVRAGGVGGPFNDTGSVITLGPMVFANGRDSARPSEGRVSVGTATDNLLIDASSDSPDTFTLTVTSDGSTTIFSVPFSDTRQFEVPLLDGVDVGF